MKETVAFVRRMCWAEVRVRADNEPALVAIMDAAKTTLLGHGVKVHLAYTPRYSSQSLGAVGAMQRGLQEQVRCLRTDVEQKYGIKIDPTWVIWTHLVPYAAWLIERFKVRANKRTSYEDSFGICYKGELMPFAETCLFRHVFNAAGKGPKKMKFSKADLRMDRGIYCGHKVDTNEFLFATANGTFSSRTAKRLHVDMGRADVVLLKAIIGTPWDRQCEAPRGRPRAIGGPSCIVLRDTTGATGGQQPGVSAAPANEGNIPVNEDDRAPDLLPEEGGQTNQTEPPPPASDVVTEATMQDLGGANPETTEVDLNATALADQRTTAMKKREQQ